jgi:DNA repair ATPase RecN
MTKQDKFKEELRKVIKWFSEQYTDFPHEKRLNKALSKLSELDNATLKKAMVSINRWYKNCRNVRRRGGKICQDCPFREQIEQEEDDQTR